MPPLLKTAPFLDAHSHGYVGAAALAMAGWPSAHAPAAGASASAEVAAGLATGSQAASDHTLAARRACAHGHFESYRSLLELTCAAPFEEVGRRTPVFVSFDHHDSDVPCGVGTPGLLRDARPFSVRFHTDGGDWDLVGRSLPVASLADATLAVIASRPFPALGELTPTALPALLWRMSDRALPRSYRTMPGFGVHTFRLVNERNESIFCKFQWLPVAGTHALDWDEAVQLCGADADFHRRDLAEAIAAGAHPSWELGLQVFSEQQAAQFPFDVRDTTQLVPEELAPLVPVGRLVLARNPAPTAAMPEPFDAARVIRGVKPVEGTPKLPSHPQAQATLFWHSQSSIEQDHLVDALRRELDRAPEARAHVLGLLGSVDASLAQRLGQQVGSPAPRADTGRGASSSSPYPSYPPSPAMSLFYRPGDGSISARRIAILVAPGVDAATAHRLHAILIARGAVPRFVGPQPGMIDGCGAAPIHIEATMQSTPAVLYDALVLPDGRAAAEHLGAMRIARDYVRDQYMHGKPMLAVGEGQRVLEAAGVATKLASGHDDPGIVAGQAEDIEVLTEQFIEAVSLHRHFVRLTEMPAAA